MPNPVVAQPLHVRISIILLFLISLTLILNSVFEFLPLSGEQFYYSALLGYIGIIIGHAYTAWIMWPHWQAERNKKTKAPWW